MPRGTKEHPVRFVAVPRAHVATEDGPFGQPWLVARRRKMRAELIEHEYPGAVLPTRFRNANDPKVMAEELELQEVTYLTKAGKWQTDLIDSASVSRLWRTVYRKRSPWVIWRWMRVPGESDGRGPVLTALADIRTLNRTIEMLLMAAALAMSGVYTVMDDDVANIDTISIGPGVFVKVDRNGGVHGPSILPLETKRDFNLAQILIDKLRDSIKAIMMDNQLPPQEGSVRSPTEIVQRLKALEQDSGSAFGRAQAEWVIPIVQRVIDVLAEFNLVEDVELDQFLVRVQVTSPLARAQKTRRDQGRGGLVPARMEIGGALGPQLMALSAKIEDAIPYIGERLGVPRELIRTEEDRSKIQQVVAQMIAQMQAANSNTPQPQERAA